MIFLDKIGRKRIIKDRSGKEPYLERYYLFLKDRIDFPFNIFIHKFIKGDDETDLHDHPWGYFTLILYGGYWEYEYANKLQPVDNNLYKDEKIIKYWRKPGYWSTRNANYSHRIEIDKNKGCITLFIPYKKYKDWGFYKIVNINNSTNDGTYTPCKYLKWIHNSEYLNKKL